MNKFSNLTFSTTGLESNNSQLSLVFSTNRLANIGRRNSYRVSGDLATLTCLDPSGKAHDVLIDAAALPRVLEAGYWKVANFYPIGFRLYAYRSISRKELNQNGRVVYLHRFVTNPGPGLEVDHSNHNSLDNTSANLRVVTHRENQQNRKDAKRFKPTHKQRGLCSRCNVPFAAGHTLCERHLAYQRNINRIRRNRLSLTTKETPQ